MSGNTLGFLLSVIHLFEESDLSVWVFGGWAEDLWRITPERIHNDIDFLYPATTFEYLDRFVAQTNDFQDIAAKRFSHKRAILYQDVMFEFILVQGNNEGYFTDFFSGRHRLAWPVDVFDHKANISDYDIQIASIQALNMYRLRHEEVDTAYQNFLADSL
jgi:hypothetical protein